MLGILWRSRWSALVAIAVMCFAAAAVFFWATTASERDKAAALASPQPAAVALDQFDRDKDMHLAREVHVLATLNPAYNYTLTMTHKRKLGRSYDEVRRMFVLFGPQDAPDAKIARAVVLLPEHEVDALLTLVTNGLDLAAAADGGLDPARMPFRLAGFDDRSPLLAEMARDALAKEGLQTDENFLFIEPWFEGRAVALAPSENSPVVAMAVPGVPGLLLLILAAYRFRSPHVPRTAPVPVAVRPVPPSAALQLAKGLSRGIGRVFGMVLLVLVGLVGAFFYGPIVLIAAGALLVVWVKALRRKPAAPIAAKAEVTQPAVGAAPASRDWPSWAATLAPKPATPEPAPVAPTLAAKPAVKSSGFAAQFAGLTQSMPVLRFAPFAIALMAMLAMPQGRQALMATLGFAPAGQGGEGALVLPDPSEAVVGGGQFGFAGAALAFGLTAVLGLAALWAHRSGLLAVGRKPAETGLDPWARIEAERLRLG